MKMPSHLTDSPLAGCRGEEAGPAPAGSPQTGYLEWILRERAPERADEIDPQTGLRNWLSLQRHYDRLLQSGRPDAAFATLHLDSYDQVLREHGAVIADLLLAFAARLLSKELSPDDRLAHCGHGDFLLMLPGADEEGMCGTLARFGLALLAHPFPLPAGASQTLRLSSGDERFVKSGSMF